MEQSDTPPAPPVDETAAAVGDLSPSDEHYSYPPELSAALARLGISGDALATPEAVVAGLNAAADQLDELTDDLDKAKKALTSAKAKAKQGEKVTEGRKVAMPKGYERPAADELIAQLNAAAQMGHKAEVVASDGKREVIGIAPIEVGPGVWSITGAGLSLNADDVLIDGPPAGESYTIKAWVLLVDGKPIAWQERFEPLEIPAGQKSGIAGDVVF